MKKVIYTLLIFTCVFALNLQAQTPMYYNYNTGTSANSFPFNMSGGKAVNTLILAGELNQPTPLPTGQRITAVYFRTGTTNTRAFTNLHILLAQDSTTTALTSGTFYPGPYDTVFVKDTSLASTSGGWMKVQLAHPFVYNPAKSLILFVGQCGYTGTGTTVYNTTNTPAVRRVWSVGGCPFAPYTSVDGATVNFGVDVEPVPVPPVFYYNYSTGAGANSFPLGIAAGKMVQWLVLPNEFNQPTAAPYGGISKFSVRIATGYPISGYTYTSLYIRLGQTTITSLTSGAFYSGTMDTVYKKDTVTLTAAADTWLDFTLNHTFIYNPTQSLVIEIGQCATTSPSNYPLAHTTVTGNRRVWSVGGCPFAPYASAGTNVLNCGAYISIVTGNNTHINSQVPNEYRLEQNYPNPFNPVTKISFDIPKTGFVSIKVFDVLGKEIKTLVNEVKNPGSYTVDFDGISLASGTYFYRLESNGFVSTKKMIFIK
jgi:hypothetical protein